MTFEFCGQTWDTDKPVFVVGHSSRIWAKVTWYLYRKNDYGTASNESTYRDYGIACKKMLIKTICFEDRNGINSVKDIEFALPNGKVESARFSDCFASHKREVAVADFLKSLKKQEDEMEETL